MTKTKVREIATECLMRDASYDEWLVKTQEKICREILIEIASRNRTQISDEGILRFLNMVSAISRLTHFHGLRENAINDIYPKHTGDTWDS